MGIEMDVNKSYRSGFTLGPMRVAFQPGVTAIVGENGAGKSTLMRIIAGVDNQRAGTRRLQPLKVGYLPQDMTFPNGATCSEFLLHVAWLYRIERNLRPAAVTNALKLVELEDRKDSPIRSLSGGMKRRLGFAHAILHDPDMLILDEPTVGLDPL